MEDYREINRQLWNAKTGIHVQSDFYDVPSFLKGANTLNEIELPLLGDVNGQDILHLQCHFGLDTLSLERMGARATGIDLSDAAIAQAKELAQQAGLNTTFIQSDVYELPHVLHASFDQVFTSYGTIGWLPDLDKWAGVINHFLKPGGSLVFAEFHPVVWMFDYEFTHVAYSYFKDEAIVEEEKGTYTDRDADLQLQSVNWNHSLGEVFQALQNQGLQITFFNEYNYSPYNCFMNMKEIGSGKHVIAAHPHRLPLVYALKAEKPA